MINKSSIMKHAPDILTGVACCGTVITAILSARAAKQIAIDEINGNDYTVQTKVKRYMPAFIFGGITITSTVLSRQMDKAIITGLSGAVAAFSTKAVANTLDHHETLVDSGYKVGEADIIIDSDGDLYIEAITDLYLRINPISVEKAKNKLNQRFTFTGVASVYDWLTYLGVSKDDIYRYDLNWTKYLGWMMFEKVNAKNTITPNSVFFRDVFWIDPFINNEESSIKILLFNVDPLPLVSDPPPIVYDITHTDHNDIYFLDKGGDIDE